MRALGGLVLKLADGRALLVAALLAIGAPVAQAEEPMMLGWEQLIPGNDASPLGELQGIVAHGTINAPDGPQSTPLNMELDGKLVKLPGYIVPLEYGPGGVGSFILVPYIGACVHVPPPPANQLVFVKPEGPVEGVELFDAVYVTGTFKAAMTETEITEVGYSIENPLIEPYE